MDMAPPQAPPALIQDQAQPAIQAFESLIAAQRWFADECRAMPAAADAVEGAQRQAFLAALGTFWSGNAHDTSLPRRQAWADTLAGAMRALANLREQDGTLAPAAAQLARDVAATRGNETPHRLQLGELLVGDSSYAGALVALDHDQPGIVLLFTPELGWETFPTLDDLHSAFQTRVRRAHADGIDLPGAQRRALHDIIDTSFVSSRPILHGDAFDTLVTRLVRHQSDLLTEAWATHAASINDARRDDGLLDAVDAALAPDALIDIDAALSVRDHLLVSAIQAERLTGLPADVQADWHDAWNGYREALREFAAGDDGQGPVTPAAYATNSLRTALKGLGVLAAPDDITVVIDRSLDPSARLESLQALFEGPEAVRIRLVDLAWQNISVFDATRLSAIDAGGNVIPSLGDAQLRSLVRDADLATQYKTQLTQSLRDGDGAARRKQRTLALQAAWMRFQANEARLSYYRPGEPGSLRPDHAERGFRWIEAVLDAPAAGGRRKVEGHDVVVRQVTYRGVALADIFEIGVASLDSVPTTLLYTPDAPDGVIWREFDDRGEAARHFLYHPAFREYLLDRLPASFAVTGANGQSRAFDVDGRDWVFSSPESAGFTVTGEPFGEADVRADFLDVRYADTLQLALHDLAKYSRSANDANWTWLIDHAMFSNKVMTHIVLGAVTAPFRAPGAAWRMYDSIKAKDASQAVVDFAELYTHSLALLPYYTLGRLPTTSAAGLPSGAVAMHARFRSGHGLLTKNIAQAPHSPLDSRYLARGIRREGHPDARGMYTINGQQFIEHEGMLYAARWDAAFDTVRLRTPGSSGTGYGPALRQNANGQWATHSVGLRGGTGRYPVLRSHLEGPSQAPVPSAVELTPWQRAAFRRNLDLELYLRVPNTVSRQDLLRQVEEGALLGRAPALSAEDLRSWNEAVQAAHATVARIPPTAPSGAAAPLNMSIQPAPVAQLPATQVPPGYRVVPSADIPAYLYLVDRVPYHTSSFQRGIRHTQRQGAPYSNASATLRLDTYAQGLSGVRLVTAGPQSSASELHRATGRVPRGETFFVRIDTGRMAERFAGPHANLQLLEANGPQGQSYILRPLDGRPIELSGRTFAPPVRWR